MAFPAARAGLTAEMEQCIQHCQDCHRICLETIAYCLRMGGAHAEPEHIRLLIDCLQICHLSGDFMIRRSELHSRTCAVCAEVCERCAQDCERIDRNDGQMKSCADLCRRCAESCRAMASARAA